MSRLISGQGNAPRAPRAPAPRPRPRPGPEHPDTPATSDNLAHWTREAGGDGDMGVD
jgi:hypothetical protein